MKGKIYESSHFNPLPEYNDSTIRLNWNMFKIHVSKCEKCQSKCLVIWSHIQDKYNEDIEKDFEK